MRQFWLLLFIAPFLFYHVQKIIRLQKVLLMPMTILSHQS